MKAVAAHELLIRVEEGEEIDEPQVVLRGKVEDLRVQRLNLVWSRRSVQAQTTGSIGRIVAMMTCTLRRLRVLDHRPQRRCLRGRRQTVDVVDPLEQQQDLGLIDASSTEGKSHAHLWVWFRRQRPH